ncbi:MAG: hypothetical protein WA949_10965 [Phormidesmis sp.]
MGRDRIDSVSAPFSFFFWVLPLGRAFFTLSAASNVTKAAGAITKQTAIKTTEETKKTIAFNTNIKITTIAKKTRSSKPHQSTETDIVLTKATLEIHTQASLGCLATQSFPCQDCPIASSFADTSNDACVKSGSYSGINFEQSEKFRNLPEIEMCLFLAKTKSLVPLLAVCYRFRETTLKAEL